MSAEVSLRTAVMKTELRRLMKYVFRDPEIPASCKILIVKGYILSKGCYNAGTWSSMSAKLYAKFHSAVMSIYRNATGTFFVEANENTPPSDEEVIDSNNLMCPLTIIRCARVSLLIHIIRKMSVALLALIRSMQEFQYGWCNDVLLDAQWMSFDNRVFQLPPSSLSQCIDTWSQNPKSAITSVKRFCQSPLANLVHQWAVSKSLLHANEFKRCGTCNKTFKSTQSLTLHEFKSHGIKDPIRCMVPSTCCFICLKEFWSRCRILNHVKKSSVCRLNLQMRSPFLTPEEADALDNQC